MSTVAFIPPAQDSSSDTCLKPCFPINSAVMYTIPCPCSIGHVLDSDYTDKESKS
jgi:hypothetical protein